jgi:hypothetical protein
MKSGFLPRDEPPPDDIIAGSPRDPTRPLSPDALAFEEPPLIIEDESGAA